MIYYARMKLLETGKLHDETVITSIESQPDLDVIHQIRDDLDKAWSMHQAEFVKTAVNAKALIVGDVDEFALANARYRYDFACQLLRDHPDSIEIPLFEELKMHWGTFGAYMRSTHREEELKPIYDQLRQLDDTDFPLEYPYVLPMIQRLQQRNIPLIAWMTGRRPSMKQRTRENLARHGLALDAPVLPFPQINVADDLRENYLYGWKVMGLKTFVETFNMPTILIDDNRRQVASANQFNEFGIHAIEANDQGGSIEMQIHEIISIYYP